MRYYEKRTYLLFFLLLFLSDILLIAQVEIKGLIFNEVYLDKGQPSKSWFVVYNPTKDKLILNAVRYSHIKTTNMLPDSIQQKGGIEINAGEYLVLSAIKIETALPNGTKYFYLPILSHLDTGGFIALTTRGLGSSGIDVFKYGDPAKSKEFKEFIDNPILDFSTNHKSYSRKIVENNGIITVSNFYETEPTIGLPNN